MDRAEAIERIENLRSKVWTGAAVVAGEDFKALSMAVDALREQELARNSHDVAQACEWISASERLPQEYGAVCKNVILLMDDGFVTVGWLNQVTGKGYYLDAVNDDVIRGPLSRFTHWMSLPEPPEEGGRGK